MMSDYDDYDDNFAMDDSPGYNVMEDGMDDSPSSDSPKTTPGDALRRLLKGIKGPMTPEQIATLLAGLKADPSSRRRKRPRGRQNHKMDKTSKDLIDEVRPDLNVFDTEPRDHSEEEWCELMEKLAKLAKLGKRERAFLLKEPDKIVRCCVHVFSYCSGGNVNRAACSLITNLCHKSSKDGLSNRRELAARADRLIPALRKALRCQEAVRSVLMVFAELSYQCPNFAKMCPDAVEDILHVLLKRRSEAMIAGQACVALCNLCFEVEANRRKVVAHAFCQEHHFTRILVEHARTSHVQLFSQVLRLLATLYSSTEFRSLVNPDDMKVIVSLPWKTADIAESTCLFISSLLKSQPTVGGNLFDQEYCHRLCENLRRFNAEEPPSCISNSFAKRSLLLLKELLDGPDKVQQYRGAMARARIVEPVCRMVAKFRSSSIIVQIGEQVLTALFSVTDPADPLFTEQSVSSIRSLLSHLRTLLQRDDTQVAPATYQRPLTELLKSLGVASASLLEPGVASPPRQVPPAQPAAATTAPPLATAPPIAASSAGAVASTAGKPLAPRLIVTESGHADGNASSVRRPPEEPMDVEPEKTPGEKHHPNDVRSAANKVFNKNGIKTQVKRVSVSVCGQFAAGKTSLIDTMKNERFVPDKPSTLIATVSHDACLRRKGVLEQTSNTPADFDALADMAEAIPEERMRREEEEERARKAREQEARERHAREEEYRKTRQETIRLQEEQRARLDAARAARPPSPKRKLELAVGRNVTGRESMTPRLSTPESLPDPVRATAQAPRETHQLPLRTAKPRIKRKEVPKRPELRMDQLKEKIADDILKDPEIMREVRDTETVMSIWDSGGQSVFSSIQHLFMSDQFIIYLLCFNSAERLLSEKKQQQYRRPTTNKGKSAHAKDVKDIHVPKHLRNVDHIRHWLTAIHLASGNNDNVLPPPVIIVGTFADQLSKGTDLHGHKEVLWEELQRLCKQSPTFKSMEDMKTMAASTSSANTMYLVDNTISGLESEPSPEVTALSEHINRASEQLLEEELVMKEWVRFEWVLQHLRQQEGFPGYTNRRYLAELAQKVCHINDDEEFEEMLLFYDKLRLIIYKKSGEDTASATGYDPEEIIIFNMEWLIDQFNTLIFGPEFTGGNEEKDTKLLRDHLWKTGILREKLVDKAWQRLQQDAINVNDRLLKVFEAWHLVYECSLEGRAEYVVPCALLVSPEHTILERMREVLGTDKPRMVISTADVPLLMLVQPDGYDDLCVDPDTPLPHSDYFRLLVVLMKKWKINVTRQKVDLQYNGAWLELPNGVAGLAHFVNGSVRVFLAHYEMSGALLLSVQIHHPVESFTEGYITTRNTKVKVSEVLCRIQVDVVSSLRELYGDKKPAPKLFLVPFPPTCDCRADERNVETDEEPGVNDADLGYFPWKIPYAGPDPFAGDTGSGQPEGETWPTNDTCHVCDCEVHIPIPDNAWAWTCPEWKFKLEGNSNEEAKRLLREHRLKSTRPPPPELACNCKLALSTPDEKSRHKQVMHCLWQVGFGKRYFADVHEQLQTMLHDRRVAELMKIARFDTGRSVYTAFTAEAHLQQWQRGPCVVFLQAVCESFASMSKQRRRLEGSALVARLALPSGPQPLAILQAGGPTHTTVPANGTVAIPR